MEKYGDLELGRGEICILVQWIQCNFIVEILQAELNNNYSSSQINHDLSLSMILKKSKQKDYNLFLNFDYINI